MTPLQGRTLVTVGNLQQEPPQRNNTLLCVKLMRIVIDGKSNGGKKTSYIYFLQQIREQTTIIIF